MQQSFDEYPSLVEVFFQTQTELQKTYKDFMNVLDTLILGIKDQ